MKANEAFVEECDFDIEDFSSDNFYWLDKSANRKNKLLEFCQFVDIEYRRILNHISVRWLSLEKVIDRLLLQYPALKSCHLSVRESQPFFKRLNKWYKDPMTEIYLLFHWSVLPMFTHFNLLLQREEPCIYLLHDEMNTPLRKVNMKTRRSQQSQGCNWM